MGNRKNRNENCSCGSGVKYKKCCLKIEETEQKVIQFNENNPNFNILSFAPIPNRDEDDPNYFYEISLQAICNSEEIDRILKCNNREDYLLKVRADSILDNTRLYRKILKHKRESLNSNWSLENFFYNNEFESYMDLLPEVKRKKCEGLTFGYVYSNEPNGMVMKTDFGEVMIISHALRYFLYYMNLFYLDLGQKTPEDVKFSALTIAIRIMLQKESMDFELDPRGEVPKEINDKLNYLVNKQLQFIIGHEFAHFLLDHLDKKNTFYKNLIDLDKLENNREYEFYNYNQRQEFEADIHSITLIDNNEIDEREMEEKLIDAVHFFVYLSIYQKARDIIFPSFNQISTHPSGKDRIVNILSNYNEELHIINDEYIEKTFANIAWIEEYLQDEIGFNFETYETYGSVYLNSWHKKTLKDRVDY